MTAKAKTPEKVLQDQIVGRTRGREGIAILLGWDFVHFRAAPNFRGTWSVPVTGTMGVGWPDLILVRRGRILAVELKSDTGKVEPEQEKVMALLRDAGVECHVWRPADWPAIVAALR